MKVFFRCSWITATGPEQDEALFLLDKLDWYSQGKENHFRHTSLFSLRSPLRNKRGFCMPQVIHFSQKYLLFNWSIILKSSLSHCHFYPVSIKIQHRRLCFKGPSSCFLSPVPAGGATHQPWTCPGPLVYVFLYFQSLSLGFLWCLQRLL